MLSEGPGRARRSRQGDRPERAARSRRRLRPDLRATRRLRAGSGQPRERDGRVAGRGGPGPRGPLRPLRIGLRPPHRAPYRSRARGEASLTASGREHLRCASTWSSTNATTQADGGVPPRPARSDRAWRHPRRGLRPHPRSWSAPMPRRWPLSGSTFPIPRRYGHYLGGLTTRRLAQTWASRCCSSTGGAARARDAVVIAPRRKRSSVRAVPRYRFSRKAIVRDQRWADCRDSSEAEVAAGGAGGPRRKEHRTRPASWRACAPWSAERRWLWEPGPPLSSQERDAEVSADSARHWSPRLGELLPGDHPSK